VRIRSFQSRILLAFLGLFAAVLTGTLLLVSAANTRNARTQIDDALEVGDGVFRRLVNDHSRRLAEAARLLSGDFALKAAYATEDRGTVLSALENHQARIAADLMMLASLEYEVIADTRGPATVGTMLPFAPLIDTALGGGEPELSTIVQLDGELFQMAVVPLLVPLPDAWICIGFRIDDDFAREFRGLTLSHVSLLVRGQDRSWSCLASTLPGETRNALPAELDATEWEPNRSASLTLGDEPWVFLVTGLDDREPSEVVAVLQRSLDAAMRPHMRLRAVLLGLLAAALALCALVGMRIARSVSRPVLEIAASARRVELGDFSGLLQLRQEDEIGRLAESFNHMVRGLAEKERVRSLLGKVVSPAVAQELLSKEIELGGEEREVTVLFADVRGFTTLCEGQPPGRILGLLNAYLTRMTRVIEAHDGVVDKYIGDEIMALFGAPLRGPDDAARAVRCALRMQQELEIFNAELEREGAPPLRAGVGIHTAVVVAGNMGSKTRLNYTVIGDGVNLASRLQGLTKLFAVPVVVSEATRDACPGLEFRELDRVQVKGRKEPVTVFEPLGERDGPGGRS